MIFRSKKKRSEIEDYGFARVRDVAFDAVMDLWRKRQNDGVTQKDIAERLDKDPAWVSRQLKGPGNWTLRTFGALVEALEGEAEITVYPIEIPAGDGQNYDAYACVIPPSLSYIGSGPHQQAANVPLIEPMNSGSEQRVPA
jgi:hypothetical protein